MPKIQQTVNPISSKSKVFEPSLKWLWLMYLYTDVIGIITTVSQMAQ